MAKSLCRLLMHVNQVHVANFKRCNYVLTLFPKIKFSRNNFQIYSSNAHQRKASVKSSDSAIVSLFKMRTTGPRSAVGTSLATDVSLTADPGVANSTRSHTFVEIDHGILSTVILLHSAESFKKGCCQLQAKV